MKNFLVILFAAISLFCISSAVAEYVPQTYDLWNSETILNEFSDMPISLKMTADGENLLKVGSIESDIRTEIRIQYEDAFTWTEDELLKTVKMLTGKELVSIRKAYHAIEEKHGEIVSILKWEDEDRSLTIKTADGVTHRICDIYCVTNGCFIPQDIYDELTKK